MKIKHIITALAFALSLSINITAQSPATGSINGHKYVDLGLSVKWATCNIGADKPEGYGDYYAWGEAETKSEYTKENCATYGKDSFNFHDAAAENWGGTWRMPTKDEFQELIENCDWTWITVGGHNGRKVTSKKNGKSIFLPAAGYLSGTQLDHAEEWGNYWSSSPYDKNSYNAEDLYFFEYYQTTNTDLGDRYYGKTIRPVADKTE